MSLCSGEPCAWVWEESKLVSMHICREHAPAVQLELRAVAARMALIRESVAAEPERSPMDRALARLRHVLFDFPLSFASVRMAAFDVAVARHDGCITAAAKELGVGRTTLHRANKKWDLGSSAQKP